MTAQQRPALPSRRDIHRPHKRKRTREARPWAGAAAAISTLAITTAVATTLSPAGAGASPTPHEGPPVLPGADTAPTPVVHAGAAATATADPQLAGAVSEASAALARADYLASEAYAVPAAKRKQIAVAAQSLRELVAERSGTAERASRSGDRQPLATRSTSSGVGTDTSIESATAQLAAMLDDGERTASDVIDPGPPTAEEILADQAEAAAAAADDLAELADSTAGYSNGYIPSELLCGLSFAPGHVLRCDAAAQLERLDVAYRAYFGVHLVVTDSYRSYAAQAATRAAKGRLAAVPGTSNHGWGLAIDVGGGAQDYGTSQYLWLRENAPKFGWDNPAWARIGGSKPEPWHWEYTA